MFNEIRQEDDGMDFKELERKAESDSFVAQTTLGISYLYGYDVQVDYDKAFRLLSLAAGQELLVRSSISAICTRRVWELRRT